MSLVQEFRASDCRISLSPFFPRPLVGIGICFAEPLHQIPSNTDYINTRVLFGIGTWVIVLGPSN